MGWLAARMYAIFQQKDIDIGCDFLFTMFWYPLTLYVLGGVFPGTDLWQGVDMATQQLTSIGYGGATVRGNDQKMFHAVNGLASQMGPSSVPGWLVGFLVDFLELTLVKNADVETKLKSRQMFKGIILLVFGMLTFLLLYDSSKNGQLEAFYATLISATTVGYGDIGPSSNWAKVLSAFVLPVLTTVFADFFADSVCSGDTKEFEKLSGMCPLKLDDEKEK